MSRSRWYVRRKPPARWAAWEDRLRAKREALLDESPEVVYREYVDTAFDDGYLRAALDYTGDRLPALVEARLTHHHGRRRSGIERDLAQPMRWCRRGVHEYGEPCECGCGIRICKHCCAVMGAATDGSDTPTPTDSPPT